MEINIFLLSKAAHGVIPGGIGVVKAHKTLGYLPLWVRRPLDPNLDPV